MLYKTAHVFKRPPTSLNALSLSLFRLFLPDKAFKASEWLHAKAIYIQEWRSAE